MIEVDSTPDMCSDFLMALKTCIALCVFFLENLMEIGWERVTIAIIIMYMHGSLLNSKIQSDLILGKKHVKPPSFVMFSEWLKCNLIWVFSSLISPRASDTSSSRHTFSGKGVVWRVFDRLMCFGWDFFGVLFKIC